MNRRRRFSNGALLVAALAVVSCDDGSDNPAATRDGYSIKSLLAEIPVSAFNDESGVLQIATGDLDLATEQAGLERPAPDSSSSSDDLLNWLSPLTGVRRNGESDPENVAVLLPTAASAEFGARNDEIADEFGWSVLDVHSFIELQNPPQTFTVLTADVTADDLTDAIGDPDEDIWRLGGDDFDHNLDEVSAARPLGESVRMTLHDGLLAVSRSTPPIEDWVNGADDTLADDLALAAVAEALDDVAVYSAMLVESDFSLEASLGPRASPEQLEEVLADSDLIRPFDVLGVGLGTDADDNAVATFVYHHGDADTAQANADIIENVFSDGISFVSNRPLNEMFELRDVVTDDQLVIATVGFRDAFPNVVWQMIFTRDAPTTHG